MKSKHFVVTNPEFSGEAVRISDTAPPSDLLGLRAYKASRTPSSIITARRAAKALASSRMAAKVAQAKLEARLAAGRNDVTDDTTARYHQEVAAMRAAAAADRRRGYERTPY